MDLKDQSKKRECFGNNNIFGYRKDNGKLIIYEEEAKMIRELFEIIRDEKDIEKIKNILKYVIKLSVGVKQIKI